MSKAPVSQTAKRGGNNRIRPMALPRFFDDVCSHGRDAKNIFAPGHDAHHLIQPESPYLFWPFCTFAHVSRSVTVRLKTGCNGDESRESAQK